MTKRKFPVAAFALAVACTGCNPANSAVDTTPATETVATAAAVTAPALPALELPDTVVHEVPDSASGRHYPLWVGLPAGYQRGGRKYPVVFVTDAPYSFPLVRSIRNLLGQRGRNIEDFILVGLPPEHGLSSKDSRSRDYTPSVPERRSPGAHTAASYGEAAAYRDYLEQQVFPLVAAGYDADMDRTVFVGHSYGGLFGSYVLLTRPRMFSAYILGSPSLWFNDHRILEIEAAYARASDALPARVMMYSGEFETPGDSPRHFRTVDLTGDIGRFEQLLESRGYRGLTIDSEVLPGEDHLTIFPALVSRGLLWALPGHGPYTSG
jgi:predicted alpha/beta superfamily hydrolase